LGGKTRAGSAEGVPFTIYFDIWSKEMIDDRESSRITALRLAAISPEFDWVDTLT